MNIPKREQTLLRIIRQGLELSGQRQTKTMLGDRTTYIGMSDLARYLECPRAALAGKVLSHDTSLERLLALQRGHWFEYGIGLCLEQTGHRPLQQLEINMEGYGIPIRAHLDFTLVSRKSYPAVRILEVKSMGELPERPYPAHVAQVKGQTSLLFSEWNNPAFSIRQADGEPLYGRLTFPQLCQAHLGIQLPADPEQVSIEGWLLCLSMKTAKAFGPYEPDAYGLEMQLLSEGRQFWQELQAIRKGELDLSEVRYAQGFYPLCQCCQYAADCPKFPQGDYQPQWESALERLAMLKADRSGIDKEISEIEAALKQAHQLSDTKDWIGTGRYRFRCSGTAGRRTLDRKALHGELEEIFAFEKIEGIDVDALLTRCEKQGEATARLSISYVKGNVPQQL